MIAAEMHRKECVIGRMTAWPVHCQDVVAAAAAVCAQSSPFSMALSHLASTVCTYTCTESDTSCVAVSYERRALLAIATFKCTISAAVAVG